MLDSLDCVSFGLLRPSDDDNATAGEPKDLSNSIPKSEDQWQNLAFPTYLQSEVDDFCQDWDEALQVTTCSFACIYLSVHV